MNDQSTIRMSQSESINELVAALAKAQGAMKPAVFNQLNPHFRNRYADLAAVIEAIREPLASNGLAFIQPIVKRDGERVLLTRLCHSSGQWIESDYPLPMIARPQEFGSALTYGRRYSLSALLGIASDADDDANAAEVAQQPKVPARRPKPPAENVMVGGRPDGTMGVYDPQTGEVTEPDPEYLRYDSMLRAAAEGRGGLPAKDKLKEVWVATPIPMQHRLQGNLPDYKRIAEGTDIGYDMAREPR